MADAAISETLALQETNCLEMGSPFSAAMLAAARADFEAGGAVCSLLAPWAGKPFKRVNADALSLRLLAAFHELSLSGDAPALTAYYPNEQQGGDANEAWAAARALIVPFGARLTAFMTHEPQTNEVRRSICLIGGFHRIAGITGLPLRCIELGASAGLNMSWDRFRYQLGGAAWGGANARLALDTDWRGAPPILAPLSVHARAGCDRKPIDLNDPAQRRRLASYVWPDQPERLARMRSAIEITLDADVDVQTADAVDFARDHAAPHAGIATTLYHSVFWQYMPAESQTALRAVIAAHGAAATREAPFAWLAMEPDSAPPHEMEVRLTMWPGGTERTLAKVHAHGAWVEWLA